LNLKISLVLSGAIGKNVYYFIYFNVKNDIIYDLKRKKECIMKENFYPKEFTWESLGCKYDNASLTLLRAEIAFYETIYNDNKDKLEKYDAIDCRLAIASLKIAIETSIPMLGFNQYFINEINYEIETLRLRLNIKIAESYEY